MADTLMDASGEPRMGTLYLVPLPIAPDALHTLPADTIRIVHSLRHFITENARTARRFVSSTNPPVPVSECVFAEIDKHGPNDHATMLQPLPRGTDIGLMSEAGCPGIADPGAKFVAKAHAMGARVVPLTGPSSIVLALMASGLDSQSFTFHGYLPRDKNALANSLRNLERTSQKDGAIQVFIEAPYRNDKMLQACLDALQPGTRLSIAADLTAPTEYIATRTVAEWRAGKPPSLHKRPAIFSFLSNK